MSASLVGSEMCIRDRPGAARRGHRRGRDAGGRWPSRRGPWRAAQLPWGCLLYTSDAADDM
eukprot:7667566-Alexandrium_andersonii.AAC.1